MSIKILLLSNNFHPFIGGIEINSELFARAFVKEKHDVRVITWSEDAEKTIFPFEVIRNPSLFLLVKLHHWADVVLENNPCLKLSWPGLLFHRPFVVVLNTWIGDEKGSFKLRDRLKLLWLKRAAKVIAVSNAVRKSVWPAAVVISNPYRKGLFKNSSKIERTRDFVFLGRLVSDKGADMAVEALNRLKKIGKTEDLGIQPNLTIIGEGEEKKKLEDLVKKMGMQSNIRFEGALRGKHLATALNRHRFIIIPSVWEEPFGMVALEGMACGCVPIVSDGGGLPEAIGKAGVKFRRGDLDNLVANLLILLRNPHLEQKYRQDSQAHLISHQAQVVSKSYLKIIEGVV